MTFIYFIQYLVIYKALCTFEQRKDYNLTVQENLSEKDDELLQCSRWLQQSQRTAPTRNGKKNPISLLSPWTLVKKGREKYNSYYISQLLSGFMIYIEDKACYCAF